MFAVGAFSALRLLARSSFRFHFSPPIRAPACGGGWLCVGALSAHRFPLYPPGHFTFTQNSPPRFRCFSPLFPISFFLRLSFTFINHQTSLKRKWCIRFGRMAAFTRHVHPHFLRLYFLILCALRSKPFY